jgi:hypothetical protein
LGDLAGLEAALLQHYGREPETLELIASAGVLWRRGREATTRLDAEGLTVQVGRGLFKHPLVTVEREARLGFLARQGVRYTPAMADKATLERRSWTGELRAFASDEGKTLRVAGLAVAFDTETDLGRFREVIKPSALGRLSEGRDVKLLVGHDVGRPIASKKADTLKLRVEPVGLRFGAVLADSPLGRETHAMVTRGDLSACSIGFRVRGDTWEQRNGHPVRVITDLDLFEVSLVTVPAQPETYVEARAIQYAEKVQHEALFLRRQQQSEVLLAEVRRRQQMIFREAALAEALSSRELPRRSGKD